MRVVGAIAVLFALVVGGALGADAVVGKQAWGEASEEAESVKNPYKRAVAYQDAVDDSFRLAPLINARRLDYIDEDMKRCRRAWSDYRKARRKKVSKKKRDAVTADLKSDCKDVRSSSRYLVKRTTERTAVIGAWVLLCLIGGVLTLFKTGRLGGLMMIVGGVAPILVSPPAAALSGIFVLLGLVAVVLGFVAAGRAKREAADKGGATRSGAASGGGAPSSVPSGGPPAGEGPSGGPLTPPGGGRPSRLRPRSMAEKALYPEFNPCPRCGETRYERKRALVSQGPDLVSVEEGPCASCGEHRRFEFVLPDDPLPPGGATEGYGGPEPSTIIDPGQWLELSDVYAKRPLSPPERLDAAGKKEAFDTLKKAIVAMEEVVKFCGPGDMDEPPEGAFWSEQSARMRRELPGQFKRYRLQARLSAYRGLLDKYR